MPLPLQNRTLGPEGFLLLKVGEAALQEGESRRAQLKAFVLQPKEYGGAPCK